MAAVYGIDIYHKGYFGNFDYESVYDIFSLQQLEMVLEKVMRGTDYHILKIKNQRLLFQYPQSTKKKTNTIDGVQELEIENDLKKNKTTIKALFLTPKLYALIIRLALSYKLQIHFDGSTPVYTTETIKDYKNGNYWFIYTIDSQEIECNAMQILTDFSNYNGYWKFSVFVENYGYLYLNNYTEQPLDGFYNVTIKDLQGEENHNNQITLKKTRKILENFSYTLQKNNISNVSVVFAPVYKLYHDLCIEIEGNIEIENLIQTYFDINIGSQQENKKNYDVQRLSVQNVKVSKSCKDGQEDYDDIEINEEGLQNGLIYTNRISNENVFDFICTNIAMNFCPCSFTGSGNIKEKIIYYKLERDRETLKKMHGYYTGNLVFKKV